jgi:hypothetical protein
MLRRLLADGEQELPAVSAGLPNAGETLFIDGWVANGEAWPDPCDVACGAACVPRCATDGIADCGTACGVPLKDWCSSGHLPFLFDGYFVSLRIHRVRSCAVSHRVSPVGFRSPLMGDTLAGLGEPGPGMLSNPRAYRRQMSAIQLSIALDHCLFM